MALEIGQYSRFKDTPTTLFNGVEVFGAWIKPSILKRQLRDDQIMYYTVDYSKAGKPHAIAYAVYGTTLLDWLVIAFNDRTDVFGWPAAGEVIKLPIRTVVLSELL